MSVVALMLNIAQFSIEISIVLCVAGFGLLMKSVHSQDRYIREQKWVLESMRSYLGDCYKEQIASHSKITALTQKCANLQARQHLVEKHGSETQRIELAMRLLKHGAGDAAVLQDLGLSNSEIRLLLRLHGSETTIDLSDDSIGSSAPEFSADSSQAEALARLFEADAC